MPIINLEQNTPDWLEFRRSRIGASDVPIILGESPYSTPLKLWKIKLGFAENSFVSDSMQKGHEMEPYIRDLATQSLGISFSPMFVQHDDIDWAIASLDGVSSDNKTIIEIKFANKEDHEQARSGTVPKKYYPQVQWQMFVYKSIFKEFEKLYYCSFNAEDLIMVEVAYDEEFMDQCYEKCQLFFNFLESYTPPEPTSKDHIRKDDDEFKIASKKWIEAKRLLDEAKAYEESCKMKLIDLSDGISCEGYGIKLSKVIQKGAVDWDKVCQSYAIEKNSLDKYRKEDLSFFRVTQTKNAKDE